ncbi:hypothetical protein M9458_021208, partial [Cirrhinus mrigala]
SDTLMLDNKLFLLYQETFTSLTFTNEHNSEQFCSDDDDEDEEHCEGSLLMTGTGR